MKKTLLVFSLLIPSLVLAATYTTKRGETLSQVAQKTGTTVEELVKANPDLKLQRGQRISYSAPTAPTPTPSEPESNPSPAPTAPSPAPSDEKRFTAYITGYGYPDNDPANSNICWNSGVESRAGGTGTYDDPITMAVGYVGDKSDYPLGTKFYIPNLRAYFKVQDTCASCHAGKNGLPWLDVWHGGQGASANAVISCEEKHTGNYTVIQNPASNYAVVPGSLYQNNSCRPNYGNEIVTQ